jgi:TolB protein
MRIAVLMLIAALGTGVAGAKPLIAFERGDGVWIANIDGSGQRMIADGQEPDLSPDGRLLAFNTVQAAGLPSHRQIAVANLATGKITIFRDVPSTNSMAAVWSPDGSRILFTFYNKAGEMRIGIVDADGSGFHDVLAGTKYRAYWAPAWAADGKSIYGEDMESLYRLSLDGAVLNQWLITKLVARGGMSGDERMQASPDGKTLLMDMEMDEHSRKDWDGPPPSIWLVDLATMKATRLTPKSLYAWDSDWLDAGDILFTGQPPGDRDTSVWRMSLTGHGKDHQQLAKNADTPSTGGE